MRTKVLAPIKETTEDYEAIEKKLLRLFRDEIYVPLIRELGVKPKTLQNSSDDLLKAIQSGRLIFAQGQFTGKFNASISKELRRMGAQWDRRKSKWKLPQASLPIEIRSAIAASEARFKAKIAGIDQKLAQILPEEIADKISITKNFSSALWKVDRKVQASVKGITVSPKLTPEAREKIAGEWQNNMKIWIKDWTEKEIVKLRKDIQKTAFAGDRYESTIATIQKSYGASANKAKFLARQETSLLMSKFKETRYSAAGVDQYIWTCSAGSPTHPVRPMHKALNGKIFRWDNPPISNEKGQRNNPGQDFNCRCFAKPIIKF